MELVVVRIAGSWSIMVDGRRRGRFDYEVDAVEGALRLAEELRAGDRTVRVLLQDRFGELRPVEAEPVRAV
jgi:hypothetical protein